LNVSVELSSLKNVGSDTEIDTQKQVLVKL